MNSESGTEAGVARLDEKQATFLGQIYHERDHLRRTIGTTYGMLLDALRAQLAHAFPPVFDEAADYSRAKLQPLIGDVLTLHGVEDLSDAQRKLLSADYANMALLGTLTADSFQLAQDALRNCFTWSGNALRDFRLLPPFRQFRGNGQPLQVNGQIRVLSGEHILEMFALGEETNQVARFLPKMERILGLHKELAYSFTIAAWYTLFKDQAIPDPLDQPGAEGLDGAPAFRMFPLELFAAADLALWPPFRPPAGSIAPEVRWVDIQPGARFLSALAALRDRVRPMTVIPATSTERTEALHSIQGELCNELGWATPSQLNLEWLGYFESIDETATPGDWPFLEGPASFRWRSARQLLELRKSQAGDTVLNTFGEAQRDLPTEVALIVDSDQRDLSRELLIEGDDDNVDCLQFYLMNAIRQMSFDEPDHRLLLALPRFHKDEAIKALMTFYGARASKSRERLSQEAASMLHVRGLESKA